MACGNGREEALPQFDASCLRLVVVGERSCGKSKFISQFYSQADEPKEEGYYNGVKFHRCHFPINDDDRELAIFEIPSNEDFPIELKESHYRNAHFLIFMVAINDRHSLDRITSRWIGEITPFFENVSPYIAVVGNKLDLRNNEQELQRLNLLNQAPVTRQQLDNLNFPPNYQEPIVAEVSSFNEEDVLQKWRFILQEAMQLYYI